MRKKGKARLALCPAFSQPAMQRNPYFRISEMGEAVGVGRDAGRGAVSLIVHKPGRPVCQTRPLCTTQAPPRVVGCHGTFSTASLFNIIICVIQHLPFIYFYLFFSLGNLGSSPGRLQKSLSTCSSSGPPPLSPILGAAVLMG